MGISCHVSRLTVGMRFECHAKWNVLKAGSPCFGVITGITIDGKELKWPASNREMQWKLVRPVEQENETTLGAGQRRYISEYARQILPSLFCRAYFAGRILPGKFYETQPTDFAFPSFVNIWMYHLPRKTARDHRSSIGEVRKATQQADSVILPGKLKYHGAT